MKTDESIINSRQYKQVRDQFLKATGIDLNYVDHDKVTDDEIRQRVIRDYGIDIKDIDYLVIDDGQEVHGYVKRKVIKKSVILNKGGKGEAHQRRNPITGNIEEVCRCWYNADFSRGCIAQVHACNLLEVLKNEGHYAPGNLKKYYQQGLTDQRCSMCF